MEIVVVERRIEQGIDYEELAAMESRASACFQMNNVRPLLSYLSKDKKRMLCLYEAPDAETVRRANRTAGMPFDEVWTAEVIHAQGADRAPDGAAGSWER